MKKILLLALTAFFAVSISAQSKMRIWMGDVVAYEQNVTQIDSVTFVLDNSEGALSGEFSVSPTKKVHFSKGNLQYQASTDTWRFAEHQWDFVGDDVNGTVYENGVKCNNYLISDTYSGWIDLFGWGTGDRPTQYDLSADYDIFVDWGNNTISNSPKNVRWRTPEVAEYEYLLNERDNASQLYGLSYVNNYIGLVLLPDNWDSGTIQNSYSIDEWVIMEQKGAIFLPASDSRKGQARDTGSTGGYYWSATIYSSSYGASTLRLWDDDYYSPKVDISYYDVRSYGRFVRLITDDDINDSGSNASDNLADKWSGFIIEATENQTTIVYDTRKWTWGSYNPNSTFNCSTLEGGLWYSFDAQTWKEWSCGDSLILNKGQQICLKGNRQYYCVLDEGYYRLLITNGSFKGYGYISSLFDNGDQYITTSFVDNAFTNFFEGNCFIELSFPEGVTDIGTTYIYSYSFCLHQEGSSAYEYGYTSIKLPSTLKTLGCTCFENAKIKEITIPRSVTYIGNAAFNGCAQLETVNYLGTIEEWNAINKGNYKWWGSTSPATVVHCLDGDAPF